MNKKSIALIVTAAACSSVSLHSLANDGFYLGGQLSNNTLSHSIERDTGSATNASITSQAEETDFAVGIFAGYKHHLTENAFIAVEGFYNSENAETTNINNMLQTKIDLTSSYGINFKAGFDVTKQFSVYGILGAVSLEFDIDNSYPFAPPMRSGDGDEVGFTYGVGAEYAVNDAWAVRAEFTQVNDVDFTPLPEVAIPGKINPNELDYQSFNIGVSYSF